MFWIILLIGLYILGVIVCRNMFAKYMKYLSEVDVLICFLPFLHWLMAMTIWLGESDKGEEIIDKFFGGE